MHYLLIILILHLTRLSWVRKGGLYIPIPSRTRIFIPYLNKNYPKDYSPPDYHLLLLHLRIIHPRFINHRIFQPQNMKRNVNLIQKW